MSKVISIGCSFILLCIVLGLLSTQIVLRKQSDLHIHQIQCNFSECTIYRDICTNGDGESFTCYKVSTYIHYLTFTKKLTLIDSGSGDSCTKSDCYYDDRNIQNTLYVYPISNNPFILDMFISLPSIIFSSLLIIFCIVYIVYCIIYIMRVNEEEKAIINEPQKYGSL